MAKTATQLFAGALTTTLTTTLYTAPALTPAAIVKQITLANKNTTTARLVTIDFGANKTLLPAYSISPSGFLSISLSHVLPTGATIRGGQDIGTDVECVISGIVYS